MRKVAQIVIYCEHNFHWCDALLKFTYEPIEADAQASESIVRQRDYQSIMITNFYAIVMEGARFFIPFIALSTVARIPNLPMYQSNVYHRRRMSEPGNPLRITPWCHDGTFSMTKRNNFCDEPKNAFSPPAEHKRRLTIKPMLMCLCLNNHHFFLFSFSPHPFFLFTHI